MLSHIKLLPCDLQLVCWPESCSVLIYVLADASPKTAPLRRTQHLRVDNNGEMEVMCSLPKQSLSTSPSLLTHTGRVCHHGYWQMLYSHSCYVMIFVVSWIAPWKSIQVISWHDHDSHKVSCTALFLAVPLCTEQCRQEEEQGRLQTLQTTRLTVIEVERADGNWGEGNRCLLATPVLTGCQQSDRRAIL